MKYQAGSLALGLVRLEAIGVKQMHVVAREGGGHIAVEPRIPKWWPTTPEKKSPATLETEQ